MRCVGFALGPGTLTNKSVSPKKLTSLLSHTWQWACQLPGKTPAWMTIYLLSGEAAPDKTDSLLNPHQNTVMSAIHKKI